MFACLEYLEAVPWADDEEEKVTALMGQLQLEPVGVAADVMKRCSVFESSNSEDVLVRLLHSVTKGQPTTPRNPFGGANNLFRFAGRITSSLFASISRSKMLITSFAA